MLAKSVLFGLEIAAQQPLQSFSAFAFGWIESYPVLELFSVIVFVPVVMNAFAFWVQDNFLMKHKRDGG